jgi:hypothetical protein
VLLDPPTFFVCVYFPAAGITPSSSPPVMKIHPAFFGVLLVLLIAVFFYQHNKTAQLQSALDAIASDRTAMSTELKELNRRVTEQKRRETAASLAPISIPTQVERSAPPPPAAPVREEPVATPGVSITAPSGWHANGSNTKGYVVGVDQTQTWGGMPSAYVKSNGATGKEFGGMMQTISSEDFTGKRVRLSGWIKTEDANDGGGHLWLRVDGQDVGRSLQFDNMDNRPVKGTSDWQEASVVLDVPANASALAYGFFVQGTGKMWVSGTKIEPVGADVPSTNMKQVTNPPARKALPKTPVNLGFFPDAPK